MTDDTEPTIEFADVADRVMYLRLRELVTERDRLDREIETLKADFKRKMGDNTAATIDNQPVFTFRKTAKFAAKDFTVDNPVLAKEFTRPVLRDELDVAALAAAHPNLYEKYRVRQFNTMKV